MKYRIIETPMGVLPQYSLDDGKSWRDIGFAGEYLGLEAAKIAVEKHRKSYAVKSAVKVLWEG